MLIFERRIENRIKERLGKGRAILIFGPRQVGKTTLAKKLLLPHGEAGGYFNCELTTVRKHFLLGQPEALLELIGKKKTVVFDEAQTIENIGAILKAFLDTYPDIQVIATGSSSFDLANKINEPLTGRAFEFVLLPLALDEIARTVPVTEQLLLELLRLGSYPAIVGEPDATVREDLLRNIATNYLYKDIFIFESLRRPKLVEDLLVALAQQVGSTVSLNELAETLGATRTTVQKYLTLLEQAYVIFRLPSFSRNPRNELKKAFKIFFYDTGIRNAVLDRIAPVAGRGDKGALLENFVVLERMKHGMRETFPPKLAFWRTRKGEEIDLIEEHGEALSAYEYKWKDENVSFRTFLRKYPNAHAQVVTFQALVQR